MRVLVHVGVGDHPGHVLAVEVVVGAVDVPHAPVGVVVAVGARAEVAVIPERLSLPVVVVMAGVTNEMFILVFVRWRLPEAVHLDVGGAVILLLGDFGPGP